MVSSLKRRSSTATAWYGVSLPVLTSRWARVLPSVPAGRLASASAPPSRPLAARLRKKSAPEVTGAEGDVPMGRGSPAVRSCAARRADCALDRPRVGFVMQVAGLAASPLPGRLGERLRQGLRIERL